MELYAGNTLTIYPQNQPPAITFQDPGDLYTPKFKVGDKFEYTVESIKDGRVVLKLRPKQ